MYENIPKYTQNYIFTFEYSIIHSSLPHSFMNWCQWILLEENYSDTWNNVIPFGGQWLWNMHPQIRSFNQTQISEIAPAQDSLHPLKADKIYFVIASDR